MTTNDEAPQGLEKFGIDQQLVDELVKLGYTPQEAVVRVADGDGEALVKEARLKQSEGRSK